jgi:hypothetical protein
MSVRVSVVSGVVPSVNAYVFVSVVIYAAIASSVASEIPAPPKYASAFEFIFAKFPELVPQTRLPPSSVTAAAVMTLTVEYT